jgi:hypothetical protein
MADMVRLGPRFEFGTKAATLHRLGPQLKRSSVPELLSFPVARWEDDRAAILEEVRDRFGLSTVVVRSSARAEDGADSSLAGAFASVAGVAASDADSVTRAVREVIASYRGHEARYGDGEDEVIVQAMIQDVLLSGVLLTQEMNTGAPYYVINYDDSGATDTVTAGSEYTNRTLCVFRDAWRRLASKRFLLIIEAVREIEELTGSTNLDIEFALDRDFHVHIFQVRAISTQKNWNRGLALRIADTLSRLEQALSDRYGADGDPQQLGGAVMGNMPDWNPAEMIGTTPRPLAFSLYRHLITDRVWRTARRQMGYREHCGVPLMLSLSGQPYIDVRESLYSYLPAGVPEETATRLVSAWLDRLRANEHLHDKLEFDVAVTALVPDFEARVASQFPGVLSADEQREFRAQLTELTNALLTGRRASIAEQRAAVETLAGLRNDAPAPRVDSVIQLLEDGTTYGTLPFSMLARHAFIATSILRGLVARSALPTEASDRFLRSVPTVATEFIRDLDRFTSGELDEEALVERYGHLRPGTYDILSMRYAEYGFHRFARTAVTNHAGAVEEPFELTHELDREISRLLESEGFTVGASELFDYMRDAIQAREYAKFCFSRNLSDALEVIAQIGHRHGLSREELSYVDVRRFVDCFVEPGGRSTESELRRFSEEGRERHDVAKAVRLPSLITRLSDLTIVPLMVELPNYITRENTRGEVVEINGSLQDTSAIDGRIVAIESADPGFDWIFTRPILGLVTRFGGANSHMAIRCAEFGVPAAIGCGEQIYERIVRCGVVSLHCADGQILMDH